MPMDDLAIDAQHLARRFGRRWALFDVTFQLRRGSVLMLAGRNGSGKTTLLRVLATLLRPDIGRAAVAGLDVAKEREPLRRKIALLSHSSYLYESLTARENLDLIARFCGGGDPQPLLERVGLASRANDVVATFSAGMRKRLSFARVLLQQPEVVFLDEPYGQLDPEGFQLVDEVIGELKQRGTTIVVATHQVEHVVRYADERIALEAGRIAA